MSSLHFRLDFGDLLHGRHGVDVFNNAELGLVWMGLYLMQNSPYYISAELIGAVEGEESLERHDNVEVLLE